MQVLKFHVSGFLNQMLFLLSLNCWSLLLYVYYGAYWGVLILEGVISIKRINILPVSLYNKHFFQMISYNLSLLL
jgi:hypothetical protein